MHRISFLWGVLVSRPWAVTAAIMLFACWITSFVALISSGSDVGSSFTAGWKWSVLGQIAILVAVAKLTHWASGQGDTSKSRALVALGLCLTAIGPLVSVAMINLDGPGSADQMARQTLYGALFCHSELCGSAFADTGTFFALVALTFAVFLAWKLSGVADHEPATNLTKIGFLIAVVVSSLSALLMTGWQGTLLRRSVAPHEQLNSSTLSLLLTATTCVCLFLVVLSIYAIAKSGPNETRTSLWVGVAKFAAGTLVVFGAMSAVAALTLMLAMTFAPPFSDLLESLAWIVDLFANSLAQIFATTETSPGAVTQSIAPTQLDGELSIPVGPIVGVSILVGICALWLVALYNGTVERASPPQAVNDILLNRVARGAGAITLVAAYCTLLAILFPRVVGPLPETPVAPVQPERHRFLAAEVICGEPDNQFSWAFDSARYSAVELESCRINATNSPKTLVVIGVASGDHGTDGGYALSVARANALAATMTRSYPAADIIVLALGREKGGQPGMRQPDMSQQGRPIIVLTSDLAMNEPIESYQDSIIQVLRDKRLLERYETCVAVVGQAMTLPEEVPRSLTPGDCRWQVAARSSP